jgi:hypothetical protein
VTPEAVSEIHPLAVLRNKWDTWISCILSLLPSVDQRNTTNDGCIDDFLFVVEFLDDYEGNQYDEAWKETLIAPIPCYFLQIIFEIIMFVA